MFQRKNPELKEIDLLNKFNIVENKIDILNSKFESECYDCKNKDNKTYEMLIEYFELKFKSLKQSLTIDVVQEVDNNNNNNITIDNDSLKVELDNFKANLLNELKVFLISSSESSIDKINIKELLLKLSDKISLSQSQIINSILENKPIDHQEYHIKHQTGINNIQNFISSQGEILKNNDLKLRNDLQSFLVGLQTNIIRDVKENNNQNINSIIQNTLESNKNQLQEFIKDINTREDIFKDTFKDSLNEINNKINDFYFENELIKHQLLLEENISKYNDELEALKVNIKNTIDDIDVVLHP